MSVTTDPAHDEVRLSRDAALVLFELLACASTDGSLRPIRPGDQEALWHLEGELERILPEPFLPNYTELVDAARSRLAPSHGDGRAAAKDPLIAFVDVDDTLVRSAGSKRIPMAQVIDRVQALHASGARLYCWSTAGAEYARSTAAELGLSGCFVDYLGKPHLLVDDQPPAEWRNMLCLHPNEISSMSAADIAKATGRTAG